MDRTIPITEESETFSSEADPALELRLVRDSFYGYMTIEAYSPQHDITAVLGTFDGKKTLIERKDEGTGKLTARYHLLNEADRTKAKEEYRRMLELLRKGAYDASVENGELKVEFTSG